MALREQSAAGKNVNRTFESSGAKLYGYVDAGKSGSDE